MKYHNITHDDMKNGDGLRVVLWVSGCSHHCKGCQNPCTWDPNDGLDFDDNAKKEIFDELDNDYISGITLSGGDPLFKSNIESISKLICEIRAKYGSSKSIWLYTGYKWEDIKSLGLIEMIDVLVDGEFEEDKLDNTLLWKGSSNQRVIDVKKSLKEKSVILHCNNYSK